MSDRLRSKGSRHFTPRALEEAAELNRLAPLRNGAPCPGCGSCNRTFNTAGAAFCQRCGRKDPAVRRASVTTLRPGQVLA